MKHLNTHPKISQILLKGIATQDDTFQYKGSSAAFQAVITAQQAIGWQATLNGQIAKQWRTIQKLTTRNIIQDGEHTTGPPAYHLPSFLSLPQCGQQDAASYIKRTLKAESRWRQQPQKVKFENSMQHQLPIYYEQIVT